MAITLGLVEAVDDNGVYVTMPGSRGVLRGPYKALATVVAGDTVLVASTDDGEQVVVGRTNKYGQIDQTKIYTSTYFQIFEFQGYNGRLKSNAASSYFSIDYGGTFEFNGAKVRFSASHGIEYGSSGPLDLAGAGSPEGAKSAPVGSTYRRTDGGAGTSFYVKESGTGNTGWVAK